MKKIAIIVLTLSFLGMFTQSVIAQEVDLAGQIRGSAADVKERKYWYGSYVTPGTQLPNGQTVGGGTSATVPTTRSGVSGPGMNFKGFVDFLVSSVVTPLFSIFLGAAVVFFLWNMLQMVRNSDQPEERSKMKEQAIWGIVAIAVMVSMWGLVNFFTGSLGLNNNPVNLERFSKPL